MKSQNATLKILVTLLSLILVLQGCRVYHPETVPIQTVTATNKPVKVILDDNEPYYFKSLTMKNGQLLATAHIHSSTAEYLDMQQYTIVDQTRSTITFELPIAKVNSIHKKNQTTSTLVTVLAGLGFLGLLVYIGYSNMSISVWN